MTDRPIGELFDAVERLTGQRVFAPQATGIDSLRVTVKSASGDAVEILREALSATDLMVSGVDGAVFILSSGRNIVTTLPSYYYTDSRTGADFPVVVVRARCRRQSGSRLAGEALRGGRSRLDSFGPGFTERICLRFRHGRVRSGYPSYRHRHKHGRGHRRLRLLPFQPPARTL